MQCWKWKTSCFGVVVPHVWSVRGNVLWIDLRIVLCVCTKSSLLLTPLSSRFAYCVSVINYCKSWKEWIYFRLKNHPWRVRTCFKALPFPLLSQHLERALLSNTWYPVLQNKKNAIIHELLTVKDASTRLMDDGLTKHLFTQQKLRHFSGKNAFCSCRLWKCLQQFVVTMKKKKICSSVVRWSEKRLNLQWEDCDITCVRLIGYHSLPSRPVSCPERPLK